MRTACHRSLIGLELLEGRDVPAMFTVTNALDAGLGSLRQAILDANATAGADSITFDPGAFSAPQTITLISGQLVVSDSVTITGPGADLLSVNGNSASRVFLIDDGIAEVRRDVSIEGLTITGGLGGGGGIANRENLALTNATVSGNVSFSAGGGVYNFGALVLENTTVSGNTAVGYGGGIHNFRGTVTLTNATVSGNTAPFGGGIYSTHGTVTLTNSTVSGNTASSDAGGIATSYGTVTLANSTVSGNTAVNSSGGIANGASTLALVNSTVSGNMAGLFGGGISNSYGTVTVENGTVSSNSAELSGGGLYIRGGDVALSGATVSGNSAGSDGGGILNRRGNIALTNASVSGNTALRHGGGFINYRGTVVLSNVTVSGNGAEVGGGAFNGIGQLTLMNATVSGNTASDDGGGIYNNYTLTLANSIVANSTGRDVFNNGAIALLGTNLVEDGSVTGANVLNVDPLLGPLTDNGGPTKTHALLAGSPAVDAGDNAAVPAGVTTDQRGLSRIARGVVDLGAFEVQNQAPTVTDFSVSGFEDTAVAIARANFEAAFIDPDSTLDRVRIIDLPANGTLTLHGVAVSAGAVIPAAELDDLVFQPALNYFGTATFHYAAADEYGFDANSGTVTLVIAPVNDAPTVSAPGPQTAYEDVDLALPITVGDVDSGALTVTLSVANGTLTVGSIGGLTVTGNGTGAITLAGAPATLNAALASLVYRGARNFAGSDTLIVAASDGSLTTTASVAIQVKSATEQATDLIARVSALEAAGALNHGQATALRASLHLKGNNGDAGKVASFLAKVRAFEAVGILSSEDTSILLDFGGILLLSVSRR